MAEHLAGFLPFAIVLGATTGDVKYASPATENVLGCAIREENAGRTPAAPCLPTDASMLDLTLSERLDFLAGLLAPDMAEMLLNGLREQLAKGALAPDAWGLIMLPNAVAQSTHHEQRSGGEDTRSDSQELAEADDMPATAHQHALPRSGPSSGMSPGAPEPPPPQQQQQQPQDGQPLQVPSPQRQQQPQPDVLRQEPPQPAPQQPPRQLQPQQASHQHPPRTVQAQGGTQEHPSSSHDVGSGPVAAAPQRQDTDRAQPRMLRPPRALTSDGDDGNPERWRTGGQGDSSQQPYYLTELAQLQNQTYPLMDAVGQPSMAAALRSHDNNVRRILLDSAESVQQFIGMLPPRTDVGIGGGGENHGVLFGGVSSADGGGGSGSGQRRRPLRRGFPIESGPSDADQRGPLDDSARLQNAGGGDGAPTAAAAAAEDPAAGGSAAEHDAPPASPAANDGGDAAVAPVGAVLRPFSQTPTQLLAPRRVEPIEEVDESRLLSRPSEDAPPPPQQQQSEQYPGSELPQPQPPPLPLPHSAPACGAAAGAATAGLVVVGAAAAAAAGGAAPGMLDPETSPFTYASVEASQHEGQRRQQQHGLEPWLPEHQLAALAAHPRQEQHRPTASAHMAHQMQQQRQQPQQLQHRRRSSGGNGGGGGGGGAAWPGGADARAAGPSSRVRRMSTRSRLDTLLQAYDAGPEAKARQGRRRRRRRAGGSGGTGSGSPCTGSPAQTDSGAGPGRLMVVGTGGTAPAHDVTGSGSSDGEETHRTLRAVGGSRRGGGDDSGRSAEGCEDEEEEEEEEDASEAEGEESDGGDDDDGGGDAQWEELAGRWHHVRLQLVMPAAAAAAATAAGPSSAPQPQPPGHEPLLLLVVTDVDELVRTTGAVEAELVGLQARYSRLETLLAHEHKLLEAVFPRQAIEHMTRVIASRSSTSGRMTAPPPRAAAVAALEAVRFSLTGRSELPHGGSSAPVPHLRAPATSVPGTWPHPAAGLATQPDVGASALLLPRGAAAQSEPADGPNNRRLRRLRHQNQILQRNSATGRAPPPPAAAAADGGGGAASAADSPLPAALGPVDAATPLASAHRCVTVLFADIVGFTSMCNCLQPLEVMSFLNGLFTRFDTLCDICGVYKVETIGDCFMAVGGLITVDGEGFKAVRGDGCQDELHALKVMSFAKAMLREVGQMAMPHNGAPLQLRVGLHSGPVTAGIVGTKMPRFCLFGDTVNTASRMESTCEPGAIHASAATRELLPGESWAATGGVQVKGKGEMQTYLWRPPPGFAFAKAGFSASVSTLGNTDGAGASEAAGSGASWSPAAATAATAAAGGTTNRAAVSDGEVVRQQLMLLRQMTHQQGGASGLAAAAQGAGGAGRAAAAAAAGAGAAAAAAAGSSRMAKAPLDRSSGVSPPGAS